MSVNQNCKNLDEFLKTHKTNKNAGQEYTHTAIGSQAHI